MLVPRSDEIDMKNVQGTRRRVLFLAALISIGIILGSVVLYAINSKQETGAWELELENGKIVLDATDRAELKEKALDVTLEDEGIKELLAGKDYTTEVTLTGNATVKDIITNQTMLQSEKRYVVAEGNVNLIVVVTVTFADGSGYNIPVDWQNWTVGEPEFAQQVTRPIDEFRITGLPSTERTRFRP